MFSGSVPRDCFATRVRVACKTVSTSARTMRAEVCQTCATSEVAAHEEGADSPPTTHVVSAGRKRT